MELVVPELTTLKAMLLIRDNDDRKAADIVKKQKKKAERAALGLSEEESEELVLDIPQPETKKKGKKKVEIDPEIIEQARKAALYKRELAKYGVSTFSFSQSIERIGILSLPATRASSWSAGIGT